MLGYSCEITQNMVFQLLKNFKVESVLSETIFLIKVSSGCLHTLENRVNEFLRHLQKELNF